MVYKGPIAPIIEKYLGGLASGMRYVGADEMKDIIGKADFIEVSDAGCEENRANRVSKD